MAALANIKKTIYYLRRNGWKRTFYAVAERLAEKQQAAYQYAPPSYEELETQRENIQKLLQKREDLPLFSILVPAYRTGEVFLKELIDSLQAQTYPRWELVLADATEGKRIEEIAADYGDPRIKYAKLDDNKGISENSNRGLAFVSGAYVGLLDHDDILTPDALYEMYEAVERGKNKGIEAELIYSDEDKCDAAASHFFEPNCKEAFNLDLLLSNNYICHFLVMKTVLLKQLGFRPEYDGAQDYDLILRAVERIMAGSGGEERIVHIPRVLYHWRCHGASTAENPRSKEYAYEAGRRALQDYADRQGFSAKAVDLPHLGFYRLQFEGDIFLCREDLGAVGGKVLHKGKIAGGRMDETGKLYYKGLPGGFSGRMHRAALPQDARAVDIRCFRLRPECRGIFEETVGMPYITLSDTDLFDAGRLPAGTDYTAVSLKLCGALRNAGYRILWDPEMKEGGGS